VKLFEAALRDRRRALAWWTAALVATTFMVLGSYGAIEGQEALKESLEDMPESLRVLMGIDEELTITSPAGYLNSQWFANSLPLLLSVYGIGLAAGLLAGDERAGRLELLMAHPVSRVRVLAERGAAGLTLLVALFAAPSLALVAFAPAFGLTGVGAGPMAAAHAAVLSLALLHTAVTYGTGAWTGRRGVAIGVGSAVTAGGLLLQSLAGASESLRPVRWLSPWHWFLDARPVLDGWTGMALPALATLALSAAAVALGAWRFQRRDVASA
jgi:ABC-2 type transport system permease protein